jgi:3-dehydroquinate dehydratase/shikimate dehydrogenase
VICCSVIAENIGEVRKQMDLAAGTADIVEIRLDYISELNDSDLREIISWKKCPLIMTCRKQDEGGRYAGSEERRIEILHRCAEFGADHVDIEMSSGRQAVDGLMACRKDSKIILSYHNFHEMPADIHGIYMQMKKLGADILKIAVMSTDLKDNLRMFGLIEKAKEEGRDFIGICMGALGEVSRILSLAYGSYLTFGSMEKGKESAPGQISCGILRDVYRVKELKLQALSLYGLVGNPVSKSKGYILHNLCFREHRMNAVYLNFLVSDIGEFVSAFRDLLAGFSVTMPHKKEIMKYLDAVDEDARRVGAVNTVAVKDGKLSGFNTDIDGAVEAVEEKTRLDGKKVLMIGAGGVARAIGYGVLKKGAKLSIVNRTEEKGRMLAADLGCAFLRMEDVQWDAVEILINATSIGMSPDIGQCPVDGDVLKDMVVFDTVYNPGLTRLLKIAAENGCDTVSGVEMFVNQAARQFLLWTGKDCNKELMKEAVLGDL